MGKVLRGPWPVPHEEQESCSISSEDIRFISIETRQALQHERASFNMNSDVNPIHCRKALNVLEDLHERLDKVSVSLSQNTSLAIMLSRQISIWLDRLLHPGIDLEQNAEVIRWTH